MKEQYLRSLFKQYCEAYGISDKVFNAADYEFNEWLSRYQQYLQQYSNYISGFDIHFENGDINNLFRIEPKGETVVEIDKGSVDSLSALKSQPSIIKNVAIVSPYGETLEKDNLTFKVIGGRACVLTSDQAKRIETMPTFISHNAFQVETIDRLADAYEAGYSILYGVFGNNSDLDKNKKLEQLFKLQDVLLLDGDVEYDERKDMYMSIIKTNNDSKIRQKSVY